jgi:hypothetical protein
MYNLRRFQRLVEAGKFDGFGAAAATFPLPPGGDARMPRVAQQHGGRDAMNQADRIDRFH